MACALTQGYVIDCRDSVGGIKAAYIIELDNITTFATASGVVTGITKVTGKRFWKYNLEHNTANAKNDYTASRENGTFFNAQTVSIVLNKMQASVRNEIKLIAQNKLAVIIEDKNGAVWLFGKDNGLMLSGGGSDSGTAMGDRSGYTVTLTGEEKEECLPVATAVLSTLETAG